jgi:hypothetical protein
MNEASPNLSAKEYILTGISHPGWFELQPGLNRVGRNPTNEVRVPDPSVSSFHCEIVIDDEGIRVKDLGSTNGTFINGAPVREAKLQPGSVIQFGSAEFRFQDEQIRVVIPELSREVAPEQRFFQDGSPACLLHSELHAEFKCPRCEHFFCPQCVRLLRRAGGRTMAFCPNCTGVCEEITPPAAKKKPSFLGRLSQTLRLPFKR